MSASPVLAADAVAFFQNMLIGDLRGSYQKLLVAPVSLKQTLLRLIDAEIARGERGRIIIKTNSCLLYTSISAKTASGRDICVTS